MTFDRHNLFFTSDTHFGHSNIIKYCGRPYASVAEMDEDLIRRWNAVVPVDATVFHLGDFAFYKCSITDLCDRLNGNIYLVKGNHDGRNGGRVARYKDGFAGIYNVFMLRVDGQKLRLSHRLTSEDMALDAWNLYGHVHGKYHRHLDGVWAMDVGVDCKYCNYAPISFEQVETYMNTRYGETI